MKETIKSMQAIAEPFLAFLRWEASSGVILLACAILALIVANSPLAESYEHLLHYPIAIEAGEYVLEMGLLHWINDGLMAVFFFVIGLEIKREFLYGELRCCPSARRSAACSCRPPSMRRSMQACRHSAAGASRWRRTSPLRSAS